MMVKTKTRQEKGYSISTADGHVCLFYVSKCVFALSVLRCIELRNKLCIYYASDANIMIAETQTETNCIGIRLTATVYFVNITTHSDTIRPSSAVT